MIFLLGAQERFLNSRGKRAISVRATEVLLNLPTLNYNVYFKLTRNFISLTSITYID